MTGTKHFGDVQWDSGHDMIGWNPGRGWRMPSDRGTYITVDDPYWGHVLDNARKTYGDPDIHFDTDDQSKVRHLVFGDGSALPPDGTVVYHDAARHQNWAQNDDGTVSLIGPDGKPGPAFLPPGYRKFGDQYALVSPTGQQVGPQQEGLPASSGGFYTDPKTGVLTPKNANGDYYTLGPDGKKSFFDRNGLPLTEQQFNNTTDPRDGTGPAAPDSGLVTDEQQSGHAADAVKKLQDELKQRFTTISSAEEKLSEVLLNAHATNADGQTKLNDIQKKIVEAVNNPAMDTNTAAGEKAYLTFLRSQVSAIQELLSSSSLSAEDQGKAAAALAALYAADNGGTAQPNSPGTTDATAPAAAAPAATDPGLTDPGLTDPGLTDPGLGPAPAMPDPSLSDLMGGPMSPLGADPMSALASMLPGALGSLGGLGAGGSPLDGLSGLAGAASPLADLASGLGNQGGHDRTSDTSDTTEKPDDKTDPVKDSTDKTAPTTPSDSTAAPANQQPTNGQPAQDPQNGQPGQPPAPVAPPAAASPTVQLPDGSSAEARTPQAAQAVRDWLKGGTVDGSYRQNGMTLPPVGTPVTNGVPPTQLHCGDVAMFKDHYEPVLSSVKGYLGGNVVPLSQVTSSPDFLGFIDPTAMAATSVGALGAPAPTPAPAPAAPLAASAAPAPALAPAPAG
ncbi:DUF4226 domain-containing protein [Mycolicibacterium chlorophenolicum]|uniref:Biofilm regulator BssS n=1 Tax=Mycolicibacterium chlorophenolicum TaxID=37916 RepID=A0A0J6VFI6_9MYCO|nr:DUF4226 domain-containing protein [Mycolicibacterium chlorophenolicum]KMO69780.1 Biofilm regulator BssS [Mycolicibacterium chlorophenolicum]